MGRLQYHLPYIAAVHHQRISNSAMDDDLEQD